MKRIMCLIVLCATSQMANATFELTEMQDGEPYGICTEDGVGRSLGFMSMNQCVNLNYDLLLQYQEKRRQAEDQKTIKKNKKEN